MRSKLCEACIHTHICTKDKNLIGDIFVPGNPLYWDNQKLYEEFKKHEVEGFPCNDYISMEDIIKQVKEEN